MKCKIKNASSATTCLLLPVVFTWFYHVVPIYWYYQLEFVVKNNYIFVEQHDEN